MTRYKDFMHIDLNNFLKKDMPTRRKDYSFQKEHIPTRVFANTNIY